MQKKLKTLQSAWQVNF